MESTSLLAAVPRKIAKDVPAIHVLRLLGAVHVVLFHCAMVPDGWPSTPFSTFVTWGSSWVPFFFVLSGFGSAYSRVGKVGLQAASSSGPLLPDWRMLMRRALAVWPMVLFAVAVTLPAKTLPGAVNFGLTEHISVARMSLQVFIESFMLQAWFPSDFFVMAAYQINGPAWYVSALALAWFYEPLVIRLAALGTVGRQGAVPVFALVLLALYVLVWPFARFPMTWGSTGTMATVEIDCLAYAQMYFAGALLACWLHARADAGRSPLPLWVAPVAFVVNLIFCFTNPVWFGLTVEDARIFMDLWGHSVGIMLIPQLAIMAGLVEAAPALTPPLVVCSFCRDLAFGVYMLQTFVAHLLLDTWLRDRGYLRSFDGVELCALFCVLLPIAALAQYGVQKPIAAYFNAMLAVDAKQEQDAVQQQQQVGAKASPPKETA